MKTAKVGNKEILIDPQENDEVLFLDSGYVAIIRDHEAEADAFFDTVPMKTKKLFIKEPGRIRAFITDLKKFKWRPFK